MNRHVVPAFAGWKRLKAGLRAKPLRFIVPTRVQSLEVGALCRNLNSGGAILRRALTNLDAKERNAKMKWKRDNIPRVSTARVHHGPSHEEKSRLYRVSPHQLRARVQTDCVRKR